MLNSMLKRVLGVLCATIVMVAFQNCSEAQRPAQASDAQHKIGSTGTSGSTVGQSAPTVSSQKLRSAAAMSSTQNSSQRATASRRSASRVARSHSHFGKKIARIDFTDSNEPTQVRKHKRRPATIDESREASHDFAVDDADRNSICNLSQEELQDFIMKVNIRSARLDRTPVKVLTGAQSLLQLADGEIGIITTSAVDAETLRLELNSGGNELVNSATTQAFSLSEGQDAVLKIQLVKDNNTVVSFEGLKTYIVRFTLDAKSKTAQIGERCVLKPKLVMTEVVEVQ